MLTQAPPTAHSAVVARLVVASVVLWVGSIGVTCGQTSERQTNRLRNETSPYLQLHAGNPVNWYPWGPEAIDAAQRLGRPIFLSVGYSTCYWCHVMEEECFESEEVARVLNEHFISIKVDREERPDLDEIYMTATQLLRRRGGWPNSVFLTPDLKPFYAGTYFPHDRFIELLTQLSGTWVNDRARVDATAERVAQAMLQVAVSKNGNSLPTRALVEQSVDKLKQTYDQEWGGFGPEPKFPSPAGLFLLWERANKNDETARRMVIETLRSMGRGAIYDHLEGGFHRYSVDRQWRVPHFEKMLYDNALLAELLVDVSLDTGDAELTRLAKGTLLFIVDRMQIDSGGFKSAIDAQTDGQEGAYYIWTGETLGQLLNPSERKTLEEVFVIGDTPNFEEHYYTLFMSDSLEASADRLGITTQRLLDRLEPIFDKMREQRATREFPLVDDKILTDWNGMAISALAKGSRLVDEPRFLEAAEKAARFALSKLKDTEGTLQHAFRERAKIDAFLDDYAYLSRGLLHLFDVTRQAAWLEDAERLVNEAHARLGSDEGGYYLSEEDPLLLFQPRNVFDNAIPAANAIMISVLIDLAAKTGKPAYRPRVEASLRSFEPELAAYPAATKSLALAAERYLDRFAAASAETTTPAAISTSPMTRLALSVLKAGVVRVSEPVDQGDSHRAFAVDVDIRAGWHVNANPATLDYLIPLELLGSVRSVRYPAGAELSFDFSDQALRVYEGRFSLTGELADDAQSVRLRYQACDDRRCLAPVEQVLEVSRAR